MERLTIPRLWEMKRQGKPIVVITAYNVWQTRLVEAAGADVILVGDSLGMVEHGFEGTVPVTLEMMRLWAAWRNTSVSRTTGTAPDEITSARTWPGPTDGSWSMSPTISSAAASGTAFTSACINMISTIEVSSITSRSHSSGLSALRLKPPPFGSTSSSR